jgi:hypothetical protein
MTVQELTQSGNCIWNVKMYLTVVPREKYLFPEDIRTE